MTATTGSPPPPEWVLPEHDAGHHHGHQHGHQPEASAFARLRQRRPWVGPAIVGGVVGLVTAYTAWQDPNQGGGLFPGCPLREVTGLDCPGCGGTRALHALTHGDIATAVDHNALLAIALPLLLVAWALWLVHGVRATLAKRRQADPPAWPSVLRMPRLSHRGWLGVIAFLVAFAVVRNVSAVPVLDYLASEAT